ncbi:hypothetical protein F511_29882 [Dorcoceras hygrometricum]|uniref:Uncharacterized protein n=1 Tax=Dorcoceras hygrometricum TaxID=472368 RepID=A0A2Z7BJU5_9LAMI|nr:hypothetical protein F511_29882 [Dorcoceras hygrometricum]
MEPALDTPHDNAQQDLTGNPVVIDLTNIDSTQDQISRSVTAAGAEATNAQDVQTDVAHVGAAADPDPAPGTQRKLAHRIMVKRLATSPHDPLGITDSACKNQSVTISVQYGPFNTFPIGTTTIGKSRAARYPTTMHTSWRSNSDIACVTRVSMTFRHQVTIHLHAQNIKMFPTNETMVLRIADASLKLGRPYPHFDGPID